MGCGIDDGGSSSSSSAAGGRRTVGKVKLHNPNYMLKLNDRVFIDATESASGHPEQESYQIGVACFVGVFGGIFVLVIVSKFVTVHDIVDEEFQKMDAPPYLFNEHGKRGKQNSPLPQPIQTVKLMRMEC